MYSILTTIWDDINCEAEAITINDIEYDPSLLCNTIYDKIGNIDNIREHLNLIGDDTRISALVHILFRDDLHDMITALDRIFLNAYYRRLLRAKLECDFIGKDLVPGLIITDCGNAEIDGALVQTLTILRIICKFLGLESSITPGSCAFDRLYNPAFWSSVSSMCIKLFGETRIPVIDNVVAIATSVPDVRCPRNKTGKSRRRVTKKSLVDNGEHSIKMQVFTMLNTIFSAWSGSTWVIDGSMVVCVPARYVLKMLPNLRETF